MLPILEAMERLEADDSRVVIIRTEGSIESVDQGTASTPALLVSEATEALHIVGPTGRVEKTVDRARTWRVDAFALDDATLRSLEAERISPADLIRIVAGMGMSWEIQPADQVL